MSELTAKVEQVLEEKVRPALKAHGGNLQISHIENDILYVKLQGQCSGCPSANYTIENLVKEEVTAAIPEIKDVQVYETTDPELLAFARKILNSRQEENER